MIIKRKGHARGRIHYSKQVKKVVVEDLLGSQVDPMVKFLLGSQVVQDI